MLNGLLVHKPFDRFLRGFLERFVLELDIRYLRITRDKLVEFGYILLHQFTQVIDTHLLGSLLIGEHQTNQTSFALHDD